MVGLVFIIVGFMMVVWARWLTPRWLRNVRSKASLDHQSHLADMSRRMHQYLHVASVCGGVVFLTGVVLLLVGE